MQTTRAQDAMTRAELEAFLGAVSDRGPSGKRNIALLTLMADTGIRLQEALNLRTQDLRREHGGNVVTDVAFIGKGGKAATRAVSTRAAARLSTWLDARTALGVGNGSVFCTVSTGTVAHRGAADGGLTGEATTSDLQPGEPLNPRYVRDLVHRTAERAGIERRVTPHTLRHTFATHLLQGGATTEQAAKALGHSRTSTTSEVYSHLLPDDVRDLVVNLHAGETEPEPDAEAAALAAKIAAMRPEQRAALRALLG